MFPKCVHSPLPPGSASTHFILSTPENALGSVNFPHNKKYSVDCCRTCDIYCTVMNQNYILLNQFSEQLQWLGAPHRLLDINGCFQNYLQRQFCMSVMQ